MRVVIIINPRAGVRRHGTAGRVALARDVLRQHAISGDVIVTEDGGHARRAVGARLDDGVGTVVAWGGDGTINEVGSTLVGREVPLGIVPGGSGNGLARELGVEWQPRTALETALKGRTRAIDVGELGGRYFFNVAGTGLDSRLAVVFESGQRRGLRGYIRSAVRELRGYQPRRYAVTTDGTNPEVWSHERALLVAVANTRQYGNRAVIAPLAHPDDGLLEIVVVPPFSRLATLWHARRLFTNSVHEIPGVRMRSVRHGQIEASGPLTFHVDGEVVEGPRTLSIAVHPGALDVRVPG